MAEWYYDHPPDWGDKTGDYPNDDGNADETTPFFSSTPTTEFQTAQKEKGGFFRSSGGAVFF